MAFKFKTFAAVGALIGSLALVGCGQDEKDPNHIKVGVIVGAEQQVAEVAQKVAKENTVWTLSWSRLTITSCLTKR